MDKIIQYFYEVCIKSFAEIQESFFRDPLHFAEFVSGVNGTVRELGIKFIEMTLESMDQAIQSNVQRKLHWKVEKHDMKQLVTSLGTVHFRKTLFTSKDEYTDDGKEIMAYLLDKALGFHENQRLTEDACARVYEEAVQTSYRRGGNAVNDADHVSKEAVKDILHATKFPPNFTAPAQKKEVEYLYIDADEDHYSLQFQESKGDLEAAENGHKKNGAITKLIYVYEGIAPDAPKSKRYHLVNPHYFCRSDEDNKALWDEVYAYIDTTYKVEKIRQIYLNSDGGSWIKTGMDRIKGIQYVLDEFHLSKYILKMTRHMKDSQQDARMEICQAIRGKSINDFEQTVEKLKGCTDLEADHRKIEDAAAYIRSNWGAAKRRLWKKDGVVACSAEGHVSHVLSSRMSTRPMGWSRHGAAQMVRLREWYYNGGSMLELARYQKVQLPAAAGAENDVLSASRMLADEADRRPKLQRETAKYTEAISHSWSLQTQKQLKYYVNHWLSSM